MIDTGAPAQETQADRIRCQLDGIIDQATRCDNKLWQSVDRLTGTMPPVEAITSVQPPSDGFMPNVLSKLDQMANLLQSMEATIERFQATV